MLLLTLLPFLLFLPTSDSVMAATTSAASQKLEWSIQINRENVDLAPEIDIILDPEIVRTLADLRAYAAGLLKSDLRIQSITFTSQELKLSYESDGQLLGFLPVRYLITAELDTDGRVKIDYPWYRFMLTAEDHLTLQTGLNKTISSSAQSDVNLSLATSTKAALLLHRFYQAISRPGTTTPIYSSLLDTSLTLPD